MPTEIGEGNPLIANSGFSGDHTPTFSRESSQSVDSGNVDPLPGVSEYICADVSILATQMEEYEGVDKEADLLSHLTPEERRSILNTSAAMDPDDLEQFSR